ncbi:MAG: DUF992 domain-containing protein [Pseudomonadota bacterium]
MGRTLTSSIAAIVLCGAAALQPATAQDSVDRIETGVLECSGEGGWGLILGSRKTMRCTFTSLSGKPLGSYDATVTKFGLDIGKTGQTSMVWTVLAPTTAAGDNYVIGSLEGDYVGVAAEASAGVGLGANALVGGGQTSFALQPVSVKAQTGLNIAAGVETFRLRFNGPIGE